MPDFTILTAENIASIINDNERVRAAFVNSSGLTSSPAGVASAFEDTAALVVTDHRLVFATPVGDAFETVSHPYDSIATLDLSRGRDDVLSLTTTDGESWGFEFPDTDPSMLDGVLNHLQWIGLVRDRVLQCRNDAELAAGRIRSLADDMDWSEAEDIYQETRTEIDDIICAVQFTDPIPDQVLAPELSTIERTLEGAHVRLAIERARSELDLAKYLLENEQYDQANGILRQAHEYYTQARNQSDIVQRGDHFQFGTQREINEEIQRLGWEIETVAAEPVRQAHEERMLAETTEEPGEAIDHWERAYIRYERVLRLESTDAERTLAGNSAELRAAYEETAHRLVEEHRELARRDWETGARRQREGKTSAALVYCLDAREHVESALSVARDVGSDAVSELESYLDTMQWTISSLRGSDTSPDDSQGFVPSLDADSPDLSSAPEATTEATGTDQFVRGQTAEPSPRSDGGTTTADADERLSTDDLVSLSAGEDAASEPTAGPADAVDGQGGIPGDSADAATELHEVTDFETFADVGHQ